VKESDETAMKTAFDKQFSQKRDDSLLQKESDKMY
jgi:hypothetical protein